MKCLPFYKTAAICLTKRQFCLVAALACGRPSIKVNIKTNIVF
jgi:hypothetical protein